MAGIRVSAVGQPKLDRLLEPVFKPQARFAQGQLQVDPAAIAQAEAVAVNPPQHGAHDRVVVDRPQAQRIDDSPQFAGMLLLPECSVQETGFRTIGSPAKKGVGRRAEVFDSGYCLVLPLRRGGQQYRCRRWVRMASGRDSRR